MHKKAMQKSYRGSIQKVLHDKVMQNHAHVGMQKNSYGNPSKSSPNCNLGGCPNTIVSPTKDQIAVHFSMKMIFSW